MNFNDEQYRNWLSELKLRVRSKLIDQVAKDLKKEFPEMKGLSRSNLFYCRQFYFFYKNEFVQQPVGQIVQPVSKIPWGHNILIFSRSKGIDEASFYIAENLPDNFKSSLPTIKEIEDELNNI